LVQADETFLQWQELLVPFGITHFYTDAWGAYRRHLDPRTHTMGKQHTQKGIERKHLTLRTRIKRLTRKTICFSRSLLMHDLVVGLFINRYEFLDLLCKSVPTRRSVHNEKCVTRFDVPLKGKGFLFFL
jgi:insertion element IS1 protein InsB